MPLRKMRDVLRRNKFAKASIENHVVWRPFPAMMVVCHPGARSHGTTGWQFAKQRRPRQHY
jgi:hypothetical protein